MVFDFWSETFGDLGYSDGVSTVQHVCSMTLDLVAGQLSNGQRATDCLDSVPSDISELEQEATLIDR